MARGDWEAVIGLEIHCQLATESKLFTGASTRSGQAPNTHIDPFTLGLPGTLPVLNRRAVELAVRLGLALGCEIDRGSRFARKHYFYPDLPKAYQISQFEEPICVGGALTCDVEGVEKTFRLTRIHLEEDAGKNVHDPRSGRSYIDLNRAGVPLVEIVGEPDLRSPADAVAYMKALHQLVIALGVSEGNMERGNLRCDANISIRPRGDTRLHTRTEIKNVNSFRFIGRALAYEIERQIALVESGGRVAQETRGWDDGRGVTRSLRSKEEAHDYRYLPDPDLMVLHLDEAWIARIRADLPELPRARRQRFERTLGLSAYDAEVLTQEAARADFFEAVAGAADPKLAANWVINELLSWLNREGLDIEDSPVSAAALGELLTLLEARTVSSKMAKRCFEAMITEGTSPADWVKAHGEQITDPALITRAVDAALDAHGRQVGEYLGGKTNVAGFLVGQVMRATGGRANPRQVNRILRERLEQRR